MKTPCATGDGKLSMANLRFSRYSGAALPFQSSMAQAMLQQKHTAIAPAISPAKKETQVVNANSAQLDKQVYRGNQVHADAGQTRRHAEKVNVPEELQVSSMYTLFD